MQRRNEGYESHRPGGQDDNFRDRDQREQRYGQGYSGQKYSGQNYSSQNYSSQGYPGADRDDEQRSGRGGQDWRHDTSAEREEFGRDGDNPRPYGNDYAARDRYSGARSRDLGRDEDWDSGRAYGQGESGRYSGQNAGWNRSQGYGQGQRYGYGRELPQRPFGGESGYGRDYDSGYSGGAQSQMGFGGQWDRGFAAEGGPRSGEQQSGRSSGSKRFSDDYLRWRDEQISRFDDDYSAWTSERQKEFGSEFETWRQNRPQQMGQESSGKDSWKSEGAAHKSATTGTYAGSDDKSKKKTD